MPDTKKAMQLLLESHRQTVKEKDTLIEKIKRSADVLDTRNQRLIEQNERYHEGIQKAIAQLTDYSQWGEVREGHALDTLKELL